MRTLIVEDDFVGRKFLQTLLMKYGECDIAVNGKEALKAFEAALKDDAPYDLVCLDIMMPEMDGQEALAKLREMEKAYDVDANRGTKIIMTTALKDPRNVAQSFREQADAYIVKPINVLKLMETIKGLHLV